MNAVLNLEEFRPIADLLEEDVGSPIAQFYIDMNRLFAFHQIRDFGVMLRLNTFRKAIVISVIGFKHTRQGYGTRLLEWLKEYAKHQGYETIEIESAATESIGAFAQKHGFMPHPHTPMEWILRL